MAEEKKLPTTGERRAISTAPVLIVDDDPAVLEALTEAVAGEGFVPLPARTGREALQILKTSHVPSLILLDIMMPDIDGWEFRTAQRADPRLADVPVVVITAGETAPWDVDDVLVKPLSIDKLRRALKRAVTR